MKGCFLLAAGGHGRVVLDTALKAGMTVTGILDPGLRSDNVIFDIPVLGDDSVLSQYDPLDYQLINGVGAIAGLYERAALYQKYKEMQFVFAQIIHPSAICGREVRLGEGVQLLAGSVIQCRAIMGSNVVVNTKGSVDHDCVIGDHVFIGPGATICGGVTIDELAFIGSGAIVLPGVHIGARAIVGAGAIVHRDVNPNIKVVGNPAVVKIS